MIRLIQWCADAQKELSRVADLDVGDVEREVRAGISQLWECSEDDGFVAGYAVTRLEQHASGREWVWIACAGQDYHKYVPFFLAAARGYNLPVRVYVTRPGMRRIYERLGFKPGSLSMRFTHG